MIQNSSLFKVSGAVERKGVSIKLFCLCTHDAEQVAAWGRTGVARDGVSNKLFFLGTDETEQVAAAKRDGVAREGVSNNLF